MLTIYALWIRQWRRYIRSKSRVVAGLAQPAFYLISLGFGLSAIYQKAGQGVYMQFLAPGIVGVTVFSSAVFSGFELIWDRQFGFLKETLVAPTPRHLIIIGRTIGGATTAVIQGSLVIGVALIIGFQPGNWLLFPIALLLMILIAVLFAALGTAVSCVLRDIQTFQLVSTFLVVPIYFLSGAIYPLSDAPAFLRWISYFDPLTYGIDGLRWSLTGAAHFNLGIDLVFLSLAVIASITLGTHLFSKIKL